MAYKVLLGKTGKLLNPNSPVKHWRHQRLSAAALIPLSIWLIILLNKALSAPFNETLIWLKTPTNALAIIAWTITVFYHAALGVQVVLEDYISDLSLRHKAILAANLVFLGLGLVAILSIFIIFLIN